MKIIQRDLVAAGRPIVSAMMGVCYICVQLHKRTGSVIQAPEIKAFVSAINRAVLRNSLGEHLQIIAESDIKSFESLASKGEVERSVTFKKGRTTIIFKLKAPQLPPSPPSNSLNSECSLSEQDSRGLAGLFEEPTSTQIERWLGWGLIAS